MAQKIEDYRAGIAERARELREKAGLTQVQLTMRTGIPQTTLSKIERLGAPLTFATAYRLALGLDCSIHELIPESSMDVLAELTAERAALAIG